MNIYISKDNEEWLRAQGTSMSGIVNELLTQERTRMSLQFAAPIQVNGDKEGIIRELRKDPRIVSLQPSVDQEPTYTPFD